MQVSVGRTARGSRPTVLFPFVAMLRATTTRLLVAIPALVGFSLATATASGQAPPASGEAALTDAVELKNGGYLRGLILEVDPTSHLSLRLPDGQVRRIPIAEVASAERGGKPLNLAAPTAGTAPPVAPPTAPTPTAPAPAVTARAAPAPAPTAPAPTAPGSPPRMVEAELEKILSAIPGPRVRIEAHSNRSSFLERRIGDADDEIVAYHLVCKLPCRVDLPAGDVVPYRIANLRLQPTDWFQLPKHNARLEADLASDMWPVWTKSMLVGGIVFGVVGGSMLGINELSGKKPWARDTGFALSGVGGAFFLTSGLFWLFSPETSYKVERTP
jgi:hypothetical protein